MKTVDIFIDDINKMRLNNKNQWYHYSGFVSGKTIQIKAFGTWLQIYRVDGIDYSNCMDESVTKFKEALRKPFL